MPTPSSPASMKASNPLKKVRLPKLKASLDKVVSARGNTYTRKTAVIFYWEDDDTGAARNAQSLKAVLMDSFEITPQIHIIKRTDKTPGWTVRSILLDLMARFHSPVPTQSGEPVKSLFMFAYIGHGKKLNEHFALVSSSGKSVRWEIIQAALFADHVDIFGFLDSCYSGAARGQHERTLQILAASGENEYTRSRNDGVSFTQRFASAVRGLRRRGGPIMTTDNLYDEIMQHTPSNAATPRLSNLGGIKPIALPFKKAGINPGSPSQWPSPSHSTGATEKHVLVKLTVDGRADEALSELHDAIRGLPASLKVSIVEAFETDRSALVLLRMTWEAWARFDTAVALEIIGTVIGPSLFHKKKDFRLE